MYQIGLVAKRTEVKKHKAVFQRVYNYLKKNKKDIYVEEHVAKIISLKKYKPFYRGRTHVDMIIVMGGDGTILSVVRGLKNTNVKIFGINLGNLGFMSEIPPVNITKTLDRIFYGDYTLDDRMMLDIEIYRHKKMIKKFHALNDIAISQGGIARLINLKTTVDKKKLTTYSADGLIVATPTGSTAYSLSAGGPIVYPSLNTFIITPICPHSFTQKPIVIPDHKVIEIKLDSDCKKVNLTIDGQTNMIICYQDEIKIRRNGTVRFVRLPSESFFKTLREKLDWGKKFES